MTIAEKAYIEGIKERAAEQRLAMAAPELLEALKATSQWLEDDTNQRPGTKLALWHQVVAAIAKAEGK